MRIRFKCLEPAIQAAVERAKPDGKKLLMATNYRKSIYANIHMDVHRVWGPYRTCSGFHYRWKYAGLEFVGVGVSAQDIQGNDQSYYSGLTWHNPFHLFQCRLRNRQLSCGQPSG